MPVTKVQLSGGYFQDAEGNLLSGGYLTFVLNQDGVVNTSQICAGIKVIVHLDGYGAIIAGQYVWGNDQMSPANSFYKVTGYTANGQIAWGPNNQQVTGNGGTFDTGSWTPNSVISWTPAIQPLELQVNETLNVDQNLLDLHQGANITLTDNGLGRVTITATGSVPIPASAGPFFIGPGFMTTQLPGVASGVINAGWVNGIRVTRFVLPIGMVIARASFLAQTNSNGLCSFAIYSADGSTKIVDSGVFNSTGFSNPTIQTKTFSPVTLPAGVYWLAQTDASVSGGWAITNFNSGSLDQLIQGSSPARGLRGKSSSTSASGVMPSSIVVTSLYDDSDGTTAAVVWESQ